MTRRLFLHDLDPETAARLLPPAEGRTVFAAIPAARPCAGCFGCWVRTPGACVARDRARGFAGLVSRHDELVIVSRMAFGGFSPTVKRVVDRSIAHVLPFFEIKDGVMRHAARSGADFRLTAVLYRTGGDAEGMELAERVVKANAANLGATSWEARFVAGDPEAQPEWT
ncbi:MAG: flavodoxin family protein [Deltaproteobacteria bacterium]|jgi:multimeric flavodoxin WrbA|nr:flavodoxin family protein [Deltaproteobacteria bacterium]